MGYGGSHDIGSVQGSGAGFMLTQMEHGFKARRRQAAETSCGWVAARVIGPPGTSVPHTVCNACITLPVETPPQA